MVKGESPGRRADSWPPSDAIRKQSEKKPMPRTKSLRENGRQEAAPRPPAGETGGGRQRGRTGLSSAQETQLHARSRGAALAVRATDAHGAGAGSAGP